MMKRVREDTVKTNSLLEWLRQREDGTDLSYLSAFYYAAAVLFILTAVFAALSHSWGRRQRVSFWEAFSLVIAS